MTPREQLLEELLAERHNGGGWRPTTPAKPSTTGARDALEWDDSEVTVRRRQRELLADVKHVQIHDNEQEGGQMWESNL